MNVSHLKLIISNEKHLLFDLHKKLKGEVFMKKIFFTVCIIIIMLNLVAIFNNKSKIFSIMNNGKENPVGRYELSLTQNKKNPKNFTEEITTNINNKNAVQCEIKFVNKSGKNNNFLLTLLVNYQTANFCVNNSNKSFSYYMFRSANNSTKIISIKLPSNLFIHNLNPIVANIVSSPNKHASNLNVITDSYGISARYDFINKSIAPNNFNYPLPEKTSVLNTIKQNKDNKSIQILFNQYTDKANNFICPPVKLNAKPNQNVSLGFRAGNVADTNTYLVYLNIDNKQILINQKPYWYFEISKSLIAFKKLTFKAPEKKGKYEIYAYLIPNPWMRINNKPIIEMYVKSSFRLTLNVE